MTWKDDADFERKLTESLDDVVPGEESLQTINPWHIPISHITLGLVLTSITLNFFYLQYILPVVGMGLLYAGLRSFKSENRYFTAAWVLSAVRLALQAAWLVFAATPWLSWLEGSLPLSLFFIALELALFLLFRAALSEVYCRAGEKPPHDPMLMASVWLVLLTLCGLTPLGSSWLAIVPLFIFFLFVARAIYRVGEELGDAGYCLTPTPVKISSTVTVWGYAALCLMLALVCSTISSHAVPHVEERPTITESDTRERLRTMGFPADVLTDVSDEDVTMLTDAVRIEVFDEVLKMPDGHKLATSSVYIQTPDRTMYILNYFCWQEGGAYWNDGFIIKNTQDMELVSGALLYSKNGVNYAAQVPRLTCEAKTREDWFFGSSIDQMISGGVCYPFGAKEQRGYIFYRLNLDHDWVNGNEMFNYAHAAIPFEMPFEYAEQGMLTGKRRFQQHLGMFQLLPPDQLE